MSTQPHFGSVNEDSPKPVYAQIVAGLSTALITQSIVTSITYRVDEYASRDDAVNCASPTEITDDTALTKTSVIWDTLQTSGDGGSIVTDKGTGYNFATMIPAASFTTGGKWYGIEVWITPSSGDAYRAAWYVLECAASNKS